MKIIKVSTCSNCPERGMCHIYREWNIGNTQGNPSVGILPGCSLDDASIKDEISRQIKEKK